MRRSEAIAPDARQRWTCAVTLEPGRQRLAVRAVDAAGQSQPDWPEDVWNFAEYLYTARRRVEVEAR